MYLRVIVLVAILTPSTLPQFLFCVIPAALVAAAAAAISWRHSWGAKQEGAGEVAGNPVELLPAFGFVAIVAVAAVLTRWAQARFGEQGIAISLFITGSFDVDAAIVTLSGLPAAAIDRSLAATALAGTIVANMALKMAVIAAYARGRGRSAILSLAASTIVLTAVVAFRLL
jgi:uncharacterized membrane protein (DUF4010 family)